MSDPLRVPDDAQNARKKFETARARALETLYDLHLDFVTLECFREAGPLLHKLMTLAYYALPGGKRMPCETVSPSPRTKQRKLDA